MSLDSLRKKIDDIDNSIVSLLEERVSVARQIGDEKKKTGKPVYEKWREDEVLSRVSANAKGFGAENARRLFSDIIAVCRGLQTKASGAQEEKRTKKGGIAFLGPLGTFSHLAAAKHFGKSLDPSPQPSVEDVFKSVENSDCDFGVVPVENSGEGTINSTLDLLLSSSLSIVGEIKLPIEHNLLAQKGVKLSDIEIVYGHPQALSQCKRFLSSLKAEKREASSNASACSALDSRSAAVSSTLAADLYSLDILKKGIQDRSDNTTRFFVLSKKPQPAAPSAKSKTSIVFGVKDEPGSLENILRIFSSRSINLTKIESRPTREKQWEYLFYVDFEGSAGEGKCAEALSEVKKRTKFLKILGSYSAAK